MCVLSLGEKNVTTNRLVTDKNILRPNSQYHVLPVHLPPYFR